MFLKEFNQQPGRRIAKINKLLNEQFGVGIKTSFPSRKKLQQLKENAEQSIIQLRTSGKKFHLDPEYAKFLGIRDIAETMLGEGMYAESPKFQEMKNMLNASIHELMDSGYTVDEACSECMNRYRMDSRFAYDDEFVLPMVINAAKQYEEQFANQPSLEDAVMDVRTDMNEKLLASLAEECGVRLHDSTDYDAINQKIDEFAKASGRSRDAVVGFLNGLDEKSMYEGIRMFGRKVAEANAFNQARRDAVKQGRKEFKIDGETYPVTSKAGVKEGKKMGMFDDIVRDLLAEGVDVEQAEVVMAIRALADDIQDQVERISRMMYEDVPAITDQMRAEMGSSQAQQFSDNINQTLNTHLEATRTVKSGIDSIVGNLTGDEMIEPGIGGDDMGDPGLGDMEGDIDSEIDDLGDEEPDITPAAQAGPEAPLGRKPVE